MKVFITGVAGFMGSHFQISGISIPVAVLIWVMIYPMMMKVDFQSVKQIGKNPKGLLVTWVTNWLIKPFTMYGIAYLFLFVVCAEASHQTKCFSMRPHMVLG